MSHESINILDSSDPSRYSTDTLSHGENRMLAARLGRLQHVGEKIEGLMLVRSLIQRLQVAATEMTGAIFNETQIMEAEFQGATFRFCHFKKVKFEAASFREVRFESCTFEDCSIKPSMEVSDVDGVTFENCYIHDAEEHFTGLLKSKAWTFEGCVIATPATLENNDNTLMPLLAFTPTATVATASVRPAPASVAPAAPSTSPAPQSKAPVKETPKSGANRFDQLELG